MKTREKKWNPSFENETFPLSSIVQSCSLWFMRCATFLHHRILRRELQLNSRNKTKTDEWAGFRDRKAICFIDTKHWLIASQLSVDHCQLKLWWSMTLWPLISFSNTSTHDIESENSKLQMKQKSMENWLKYLHWMSNDCRIYEKSFLHFFLLEKLFFLFVDCESWKFLRCLMINGEI